MKTLVIVESPGKVKKINRFLGKKYDVVASVGHIRDLPSKSMGVEPPDFEPEYQLTEKGEKNLKDIKKRAKKADQIILATDPDREGEAIAWHLADELGLKQPKRATFNAITEKAVKEAINNTSKIDHSRVRAQETRRVLDRIVGFRVSPALSELTGQKLSAGRVQSPTIRMIVDREREIRNFQETEHYGAALEINNPDGYIWKAEWDTKPCLENGQKYLQDKELAKRVAAIRQVTVATFEDSKKRRGPPAPFTTATLQKEAGKRLKLRPQEVMNLAQKLYERGVITYHRTDAPNMAAEGIQIVSDYARENGLPLAETKRTWKAKEGAQEGHEAIRPVDMTVTETGENDGEKALYKLIWKRALASQMADAVYAVRQTTLNGSLNDQTVYFIGKGQTLTAKGWMAIYSLKDKNNSDNSETMGNPIPDLEKGQTLTIEDGYILTKKTKPPTRYTEPTLTEAMEKSGIGRPSTWAAVIENITSRGYISTNKKGYLIPTKLGETIRDALTGRFQFAELDYTKRLEDDLDTIATDEKSFKSVISNTWEILDSELESLKSSGLKSDYPCPSCGKALVRKKGKNGYFWGCLGYPDCKVTRPDNKGVPGESPKLSEYLCPDCESPLIRREGKKGYFWGCSGFPNCKTTLSDNKGVPGDKKIASTSNYSCPECGLALIRRKGKSKKGKSYDFYGCSGFPNCEETFKTDDNGKPVLNDS